MNDINLKSRVTISTLGTENKMPTADNEEVNNSNYAVDIKLADELNTQVAKGKAILHQTASAKELTSFVNETESLIAKLPPEVNSRYNEFKETVQNAINLSLIGTDSNQNITKKFNNLVLNQQNKFTLELSLDERLKAPLSILSMQILFVSTKIMASQSDLALKKMEAMSKLLEKLQSMTTLMTSMTNVLNGEFTRKKTQSAQQKDTTIDPGQDNNLTWDDAAKYHGQAVDHYNWSLNSGILGWFNGFHQDKFLNSPLIRALIDIGVITVRISVKEKGGEWKDQTITSSKKYLELLEKEKNGELSISKTSNTTDPVIALTNKGAYISDNKKDGQFDYNQLTKEEQRILDEGLRLEKDTNVEKYPDGSDMRHGYDKYIEKKEFSTGINSFYDLNGNQVIGDGITEDAKYKDSIIFSIDQVPEAMREYFIPLSNQKNGAVTHYAISKDSIIKAFNILLNEYTQVMGNSDDFNANLSAGVTGTVKQLENISKIMQQKIQYIQQEQARLAKTPENAKEDALRKLDVFNNMLRSVNM